MSNLTMMLTCCPSLLLILFVGTTAAFVVNPASPRASSVALYSTKKSPLHASKNKFSISLLTTPQELLPGETARIWTEELQLVEESFRHGVVALGGVVNEEALLQIASLCKISNCSDQDENGMYATLTCVGRVRLEEEEQEHPYFKFQRDTVQEEDDEALDECNLVADNIEAFMQQLSRKERGDDTNDLLQRYKRAYGRAVQVLSKQSKNGTLDLLTAISWAGFTAVHDEELEPHRLRALDYDSLLDRLKLAQYMLREKELRLQGLVLQQGDEDDNNALSDAASYTEGFQ